MRNDELLRNLLRNYMKDPTDFNAQKFAQASLRSLSGPLNPEVAKLETVAVIPFVDLIRKAVLDGVKFKHLNRQNIDEEFSWSIDDNLIAANNAETEYGLLLEWVIHNQSSTEVSHLATVEDNSGPFTVPITFFFIGTERSYSDFFSIGAPCGADGSYTLNLHQNEFAHQPFKNWIDNYLKILREQGIDWLAVKYDYDI